MNDPVAGHPTDEVRWVVFDYGEVISRRTAALPSIASMLGAAEAIDDAYFGERDAYDRGCEDLEYWRAVGARLGADVQESRAWELTRVDVDGWLDTVPESLRLIGELHGRGVALALLSNAPSAFGRAAEQQLWAQCFRHLVFSGDLELAKPDDEIWRVLLSTLDAAPGQCLFFDDRQDNVDGARKAGMHAELWRGAAHAREVLHAHGVLPAPGAGVAGAGETSTT